MYSDVSTEASFQQFVQLLHGGDAPRIASDLFTRLQYSADASFYQLVPKLVVEVRSLAQISRVLQAALRTGVALTFRAAGTSLSGQAVTDSVLVLLSEHWRGFKVLDGGQQLWLQPGLTGSEANAAVQSYGRKIGPDPASINSCKIGGIAANNASGMCCGVKHNSYHTLAAMTLVLADGTVLNTADANSVAAFRRSHPMLLDGLTALRQQLLHDLELTERVRHKYRLKNTTGYGLNALLDFADPIEILQHLMIGSEGTLGFIADITYHTIADAPHKASGLYFFSDITRCCQAVSALADQPVSAVELMDDRALRSVASKAGMPAGITGLESGFAALLIEVAATSSAELAAGLSQVQQVLNHCAGQLDVSVAFSTDPLLQQQLWNIRKGTFPAVGAVRPAGTTVIIEDVAVPVARLAEAVADLQQLLLQYQYNEAIIFGHALEGNLHFVFAQSFESEQEVQRYDSLMQQLSALIVGKYQGSLKAEHGTGRNMAPFVRLEWGDSAYQLMRQVKQLLDPTAILNPGVLINDDPAAHLKHLKPMPKVDDKVDTCIECGFCEKVCPSNGLTLTPRQRIGLLRRMQDPALPAASRQQLQQQYQYQGVDSCATTGLCALKCPVSINTGDLMRQLKAAKHPAGAVAQWQASHWNQYGQIARFALGSVGLASPWLGQGLTSSLLKLGRQLAPDSVPSLLQPWPQLAEAIPVNSTAAARAVLLFPSCPSRWFGPVTGASDQRPLHQVLASVLA